MRNRGDVTRSTAVWLDSADEDAFDAAVARELGAAWRCSQPGPAGLHPVHLHETLRSALTCGGERPQAFLPLPVIGRPAETTLFTADHADRGRGALVQYLRNTLRRGVLHAGVLATVWNTEATGDALAARLKAEADAVWRALRTCSKPARLTDPTGGLAKVGAARIGASALAGASATGVPLSRGGALLHAPAP